MKSDISATTIRDCFLSLDLARHGNSVKNTNGQPDAERMLSSQGIIQAHLISAQLVTAYDLVASSGVLRAETTTQIMTGYNYPTVIKAMTLCAEDMEDPLNVMFMDLGYASLKTYFNHKLGERLKQWSFTALAAIMQETRVVAPLGCADVFVGGHAVCQPGIAWAIGTILREESVPGGNDLEEAMIELSPGLGEAEVIRLKFSDTYGVRFRILMP